MLSSSIIRRRALRSAISSLRVIESRPVVQRRTLVSAPKDGDGPLMERRADRELPNPNSGFRWTHTLPLFAVVVALSAVAIFNYQKMSSPVVASSLYSLRIHPLAREYLGDEIYYKQQIPWISGEMNQIRGRIDIRYSVKGTRNTGVMRFVSMRPSPKAMFETIEWSLETTDGRVIDLLEGEDPFKGIESFPMDEEEKEAAVRGFRQQLK